LGYTQCVPWSYCGAIFIDEQLLSYCFGEIQAQNYLVGHLADITPSCQHFEQLVPWPSGLYYSDTIHFLISLTWMLLRFSTNLWITSVYDGTTFDFFTIYFIGIHCSLYLLHHDFHQFTKHFHYCFKIIFMCFFFSFLWMIYIIQQGLLCWSWFAQLQNFLKLHQFGGKMTIAMVEALYS
jgi:hypothetical protein